MMPYDRWCSGGTLFGLSMGGEQFLGEPGAADGGTEEASSCPALLRFPLYCSVHGRRGF